MPTSRASFRFQSSALFLLTASTTITTVFAGYVTPPIVYRDDYARTTLLPPSQGQEIDISAATGFPLYIATTEITQVATAEECEDLCSATDDCLLTLTQVGTQPGQCAFGFVEDTPAGRTPVTSFTASDIPTTISWRYSNNCDNLIGDFFSFNGACNCNEDLARFVDTTNRQCSILVADPSAAARARVRSKRVIPDADRSE